MDNRTELRRKEILKRLCQSDAPVAAKVLAIDFKVSRQVIVQDMAVIRASRNDIISTNRGYLIQNKRVFSKEFKMKHGEDKVEEELNLIVDLGGRIKNVSISHRIYGRVIAEMSIASRRDVKKFLEKIENSCSTLLGSVTQGYHYHLIEADSEETLDLIEKQLKEHHLLAPLLSWEKEMRDYHENK